MKTQNVVQAVSSISITLPTPAAYLYIPTEPYIIQSGKREGKSLEGLMFADYEYLAWQLGMLNQNIGWGYSRNKKNNFHLHLEWLLKQGETRQSPKLCPVCRKNTIKFFSKLDGSGGGFSIGDDYTCCEDKECQNEIKAMAFEKFTDILPLKFSVLKGFSKGDSRYIGDYFRIFFTLPEHLSSQQAFQFFQS